MGNKICVHHEAKYESRQADETVRSIRRSALHMIARVYPMEGTNREAMVPGMVSEFLE